MTFFQQYMCTIVYSEDQTAWTDSAKYVGNSSLLTILSGVLAVSSAGENMSAFQSNLLLPIFRGRSSPKIKNGIEIQNAVKVKARKNVAVANRVNTNKIVMGFYFTDYRICCK